MENQMGAGSSIPGLFLIFPEEVWEKVLEELRDSRDIQNVLKSFPELEGRILKNRNWWLIDQTLLHIIPWLRNNDILSIRQVCWRWLRAVDNLIETHPYNRPYDNESRTNGPDLPPQGSLAHYDPIPDYFQGVSGFLGLNHFQKFYQDMGKHSPGRNPFVGRDSFISDKYVRAANQDIWGFWTGASEFLQKFGSHVWFIRIESSRLGDPVELWMVLHEIMASLPNLKSLQLGVEYSGTDMVESEEFETFLDSSLATFPPLAQLETLQFDISSSAPALVNFFTRCYSSQIRRLDMCHLFWRRGYANILPNLTELTLTYISSVEEVKDILVTLEAPGLHMLELSSPNVFSNLVLEDEQILPSLIRFPRLHSLLINLYSDGEVGHRTAGTLTDVVQISSLEFLRITQHHMGMALLKHFPLLKYIKCYNGDWSYINSSNLLRVEAWECLTKLKEITVCRNHAHGEGNPIFHYTRTMYEFFKERKSRRQWELGPELEAVFECFNSMIFGNWGNGDGA